MPGMVLQQHKRSVDEDVNGDVPKPQKRARSSCSPVKPLAKPLGNLLLQDKPYNSRNPGLGRLAALPDELIAAIFSELDAVDCVRCQGTSRAFFAFSRIEGHWKLAYIKRARGALQDWKGSWRSTYLHAFLKDDGYREESLPADAIEVSDLYSDVLYLPYLAANYDSNVLIRSSSFANNIKRVDGRNLRAADLGNEPMILTGLMDDWPALSASSKVWSLPALASRFPETKFRAEAVLTSMTDYLRYHDACSGDESPLYIFDADFVEKTEADAGQNGLGADFHVSKLFQDDLFKVLGDERPNYRWLIAGPERSGSTFHCDPNGTSAWNAVVTGRKLWILFPPDVIPPGIHVSDDQAEVEAPLSLAEWLLNYYAPSKEMYGPRAKDASKRGKMLEGVCETGETFYVPSGWWHLVINLESSIAVTQNFVSPSNLPGVLNFLKHRADQVSGFKLKAQGSGTNAEEAQHEYRGEDDDETGGGAVFNRFVEALQAAFPDVAAAGLEGLAKLEAHNRSKADGRQKDPVSSLWSRVTEAGPTLESTEAQPSAGFSFGFDLEDTEALEDL